MYFKTMIEQLRDEVLAVGEHLATMPSLGEVGVCTNRYDEEVPCLWVNGHYRVCVEPAGEGPRPYGYAVDQVPYESYLEGYGWHPTAIKAALVLACLQVRDHLEMQRAYREGDRVGGE
jgi:hypothetical protein